MASRAASLRRSPGSRGRCCDGPSSWKTGALSGTACPPRADCVSTTCALHVVDRERYRDQDVRLACPARAAEEIDASHGAIGAYDSSRK